jgi:endoglucanase
MRRASSCRRVGASLAGVARAALALGLLLAIAACDPRLAVHVADNRLVDGEGQPIRLLGVNRSGMEYACIQDLGIFAGPADRRSIAEMTAGASMLFACR